MSKAMTFLKMRAKQLHRLAASGNDGALAYLSNRFTGPMDAASVRRRHALAAVAGDAGFRGWPHAKAVLSGDPVDDFGTALVPHRCMVHWNIWLASYEEAHAIRREKSGFLLAYRKDFVVVDDHFIVTLGLAPEDADWKRMGRDWVHPADAPARDRLYLKLFRKQVDAAVVT
ncbi:hypothetical protein [Eilatimonas milleporae]|uniref:Uncharacterized protein n=1 Tax=Eilatimonas milleporae TaxID=911205 RepID=A0A3M0BYJ3_9PROT|nr:hypothetical protein [Eilatimonas milleporae]RMB02631.1 hypothetical protein BXY39_2981 [Eilatimonas milleporae]